MTKVHRDRVVSLLSLLPVLFLSLCRVYGMFVA